MRDHMDPVSITIITGLVAGAQAVLKGTAGEAGKNAYTALKDVIISRFATVKPAVELVDSLPDSQSRQTVLAEDLERSGANKDGDVLAAAQRLLDVVIESRADPEASALFDFEQLEVIRNLEIEDIKCVSTVIRAKTAKVGGDMKVKGVQQQGRMEKKN
jgi:hypothetical protein